LRDLGVNNIVGECDARAPNRPPTLTAAMNRDWVRADPDKWCGKE
jgi:hypothetical protein